MIEKYFNEKQLGIISKAWENKKSVFIHKYKGISDKRDIFAPGALKQSAKWYSTKEQFLSAIIDDCIYIGYIEQECA